MSTFRYNFGLVPCGSVRSRPCVGRSRFLGTSFTFTHGDAFPKASCLLLRSQAQSGPAVVTGEDFWRCDFFFFLFFIRGSNQTGALLCPIPSPPVSSCQRGARIQNPVVSFSPWLSFHPPLLLSPPLSLPDFDSSYFKGAAEPRLGGLMNEVFFRSDVKVCSPDTRSPRGEVAGRRPVSTFIHRRSNTDGPRGCQRQGPVI